MGFRLGGNVDDAVSFARRTEADLVLIALPLSADQRILNVVVRLRVLPVDIAILSDSYGFCAIHKPVAYVGGVPAILAAPRPLSTWNRIAKRAIDIAVTGPALICLLPVLPFIALAVKLDSPGPLFFKQRRFGFNGEIFEIYKFRTMRADQADAEGRRLVSPGDSRVTRVGSLMRRTSIDELPQLLNVLRGEMSLVGPRPHPLQARAADRLYNEVVAEYMTRHRVKPGITGWAQVNGWRGETDTVEKIRKRVEHDLFYIENCSLAFDMRILLLTLLRGFVGRNAY
jgi:Undecaprenyl-phosphate glucose phosphotransferase